MTRFFYVQDVVNAAVTWMSWSGVASNLKFSWLCRSYPVHSREGI